MKTRNTYTLLEAIVEIARMLGTSTDSITAIEFEDGSGKSFNYSVKYGKKSNVRLR